MDPLASMRNLELDKICRVCLTVKKEMKPLFGELIAEMLMECARVQIDNTDGWPDKICIQCVHQVSRCHAFKSRVEKSDQQLRQYIKGITVIVEEALPKEMTITQIELPKSTESQMQRGELITQTINKNDLQSGQVQRQEIQIQRSDIQTQTSESPHNTSQMIITNGQFNNGAQFGQILTTANGQPLLQAGTQILQTGQIVHQGQLVQTANGNVQLIQQNGQPAQVVQIQRTGDGDRCEIIVQPDISGETQYYEDVTTIQEHHHHHHHHEEEEEEEEQEQEHEHEHEHEQEEQLIEEEEQEPPIIHIQDDDEIEEDVTYTLAAISEDSESEDKQYLAEFITLQTSCPSPGRFLCNLCHKEFKHNKWLHSHMKSHSNWIKANCKKQPQCEICHRSFKGPGMLKMHMKTHEQKQHSCDICSKKFSSNHMLQNHVARHRGEQHKCLHCDRTFNSASGLKNHMQHHLGLKGSYKKSSATAAS